MFVGCLPVCRGNGSRVTRVCLPVWGHEPASSTGHWSIWQQRSWIWIHHRSCVLQLDKRWLIGVDPVFLPIGTNYKECSKRKQDTLKVYTVSVDCIKGNILNSFFKTVTSQFAVCSGADGQMDIMLFVYRDFWFCYDVLYFIFSLAGLVITF